MNRNGELKGRMIKGREPKERTEMSMVLVEEKGNCLRDLEINSECF